MESFRFVCMHVRMGTTGSTIQYHKASSMFPVDCSHVGSYHDGFNHVPTVPCSSEVPMFIC